MSFEVGHGKWGDRAVDGIFSQIQIFLGLLDGGNVAADLQHRFRFALFITQGDIGRAVKMSYLPLRIGNTGLHLMNLAVFEGL